MRIVVHNVHQDKEVALLLGCSAGADGVAHARTTVVHEAYAFEGQQELAETLKHGLCVAGVFCPGRKKVFKILLFLIHGRISLNSADLFCGLWILAHLGRRVWPSPKGLALHLRTIPCQMARLRSLLAHQMPAQHSSTLHTIGQDAIQALSLWSLRAFRAAWQKHVAPALQKRYLPTDIHARHSACLFPASGLP